MAKPVSYTDPANLAPIIAKAAEKDDYRALVCIFLSGGNDSHNMILPRAANTGRATYDSERGTLAVTLGTELTLTTEWGVNPNMPNFKAIWDLGKAAVLMNVGFLKEPTDRASYLAKRIRLPEQLYSHNTQQELWRSIPSYLGLPLNGWMGRAHDLAGDVYNISPFDGIPSTFSIAGRNTQMQGYDSVSSDMNSTGPTTATTGDLQGLTGANATSFTANIPKVRIYSEWGNQIQDALVSRVNGAILSQASLNAQLQLLPTVPIAGQAVSAEGRFTAVASNGLAQQLKAVARIIHSRNNYTQRRHLFYVSLGGWDDHDNLSTGYGPRLATLDAAIKAFWDAMNDIGMQNNVTVFTQSEFGRALKQNGNGSDHGWGGHALVFGGAVNGGQIYGTPPDLRNGSTNDAGQGRMIPTTSVDQYAATLLKWWGIPEAQLPLVLENLPRFSPATLPMLSEPAPISVIAPKLLLPLAGKTLPPQITFSATAQGPRTYFDENGVMQVVRCNLLPNSAGIGGTIGAPNALPTGWGRNMYTGITHTMVGRGVDEDGDDYVDIRVHGVNQSAVQIYPHLLLSGTSTIATQLGWRYLATAKMSVIAGTLNGFAPGSPRISCHTLNNGTFVNSAAGLSNTNMSTLPGYRARAVFGSVPTSGVTHLSPNIEMSVYPNAAIDVTFRVGAASLEWLLDPNPSYVGAGPYLRTAGVPYEPHRVTYEPKSKRLLGLTVASNQHNRINNSTYAGAVVGTPGTFPTNTVVSNTATGLNYSVVGTGLEDGMPYMDVRLFGTSSASGELGFVPMNYIPAAAVNEAWVSFLYARLVSGSMSPFAYATWEIMGRTAGASTQSKTVSLMGMTTDRLVTQRFALGLNLTTAGIDGADSRLRLNVASGTTVDVVIRLGACQLSRARVHAPFTPTYGAATSIVGRELVEVSGAPFAAAYNGVQGAVSARFSQDSDAANAAFDAYSNVLSLVNDAGGGTDLMRMLTRALPSLGANTDGQASWRVDVGGSATAEPVCGTRVLRLQTATRVAAFATNNFNMAQRGVKATLDTLGALPTGITRMRLGSNTGDALGDVFYQEIAMYDVRPSDDDAARMSS